MHLKLKQDMQAAGVNVSEGDTLQQSELQAARDFLYFRGINIGEHFENYEAAIGAEPATEVPPQDGLVANVPLADLDNPPSGNLTIPTSDVALIDSQVQPSEPTNQEPVGTGSESAESTDTPPAAATEQTTDTLPADTSAKTPTTDATEQTTDTPPVDAPATDAPAAAPVAEASADQAPAETNNEAA